MNIYILFAHPEPRSFNGQMKDFAVKTFTAIGHEVKVNDLHASNFNPIAGPDDFPFYTSDFFDLQEAQKHAFEKHILPIDIQLEQENLEWADLIVLQFPMWWQSMPAILKGYIDRVFTAGFAYYGNKKLAGKKALPCITTGGPLPLWVKGKRGDLTEEVYRHLIYGTFEFCGMKPLEPIVAGAAKRMSEEEKTKFFEEFKEALQNIDSRRVLKSNI